MVWNCKMLTWFLSLLMVVGMCVQGDTTGNVLVVSVESKLGQRIVKKAIEQNINIIGAFEEFPQSRTLSQLKLLQRMDNLPNIAIESTQEISNWITQFNNINDNGKSTTAIICDCIESDNFIELLLNNKINVVTLCPLSRWNELSNVANKNDVFLKYYSISDVLLSNFMEQIKNENNNNNNNNNEIAKAKEIYGRITCNADFFPDFFSDFMIGDKIETFNKEARNKKFSQLMKQCLNETLNGIIDNNVIKKPNNKNLIYSVSAMKDKTGQAASLYLKRIIETTRVTGAKYHARVHDDETGIGLHIVLTMGIYYQQSPDSDEIKTKKNYVPCAVKWEIEHDDETNDYSFYTVKFDFLDLFINNTLNQIANHQPNVIKQDL